MQKILFFSFLIFYCFVSTAQDFPPTLSKQQMYEDFDEFLSIIENANPQLPVRKAVTGVNLLDSIKSLRPRIEDVQEYFEFIRLLDMSLRYMYDIHAVIANQVWDSFDDTTGIDTKIVNKIRTEYRKWINERNEKGGSTEIAYFPCNPPYIDGNYYLHGVYTLTNKDYDTLVLRNAKLILYNENPYNDYVLKNSHRFFNGDVRWDFKRKQYYCVSSAFLREGELVVENDDGQLLNLNLNLFYGFDAQQLSDFNLNQHPDFKHYINPAKKEKRVLYFEKDKILYIYLPDMNDTENYVPEKVKELGNNKVINKIIIDVRENLGGSDLVWIALLKAIVADSLIYDAQMAFLNTELMKKRLDFHVNASKVQTFDWAPDVEYLVTQYVPIYFVPDSNSLNYRGKIYVLQDENVFSAAHSITSYCRHIDQLVSVGEPTGLLAGFGLAPVLFQLKNSKFSFRLEPVIDVTKVNNAIDIYQDFPEILIELPFEEKRKYLDYKKFDMQNENNLYKYDYLFKKVLELE
ncbi:MAG: S41 family peptidase [Marinilabiliaceae bacterium]|nr:S41 family peptidase [Marinilabiliaceae bacterium]